MKTITIIGKNSRLYNSLDKTLLKDYFNVIELGYQEVYNVNSILNPIIFSYSKNLNQNRDFLHTINSKRVGIQVLIGSIAADVYRKYNFYKYPEIKCNSEDIILSFENSCVLRVGICSDNLCSINGFHGYIRVSTFQMIIKTIIDVCKREDVEGFYDSTLLIFSKQKLIFKLIAKLQYFILKKFPMVFFVARPTLIFFKLIGYKNYGYTFIANSIKKND
jgi:hypothetical protein